MPPIPDTSLGVQKRRLRGRIHRIQRVHAHGWAVHVLNQTGQQIQKAALSANPDAAEQPPARLEGTVNRAVGNAAGLGEGTNRQGFYAILRNQLFRRIDDKVGVMKPGTQHSLDRSFVETCRYAARGTRLVKCRDIELSVLMRGHCPQRHLVPVPANRRHRQLWQVDIRYAFVNYEMRWSRAVLASARVALRT